MIRWLLPLLFLASPALAADGDLISCSGVRCSYYLCDGDRTTPFDCAEIDLGRLGRGMPDRYELTLAKVAGCSGAPAVAVRGLSASLGTAHVYASLTSGGTSSIAIDGPTHRYVDGTVSGTADCTDLEVILEVVWED